MTFDCATNLTGYEIRLFYGNDIISNITDLPNGGKRSEIIATIEVNGTDIVCVFRMGTMTNTTVAYLYVQGSI